MKDGRTICWLSDAPCDPSVRTALADSGWLVHELGGPLPGLSPPEHCDVGLIGIHAADPSWLSAVARYIRRWDRLEYIAILGPGVLQQASVREFVRLHCVDYQTLPVDADRLVFAVGHARGMAILGAEGRHRDLQVTGLPSLAGNSPASRRMRSEQAKAACVDAPLLIVGERGSGKELFARGVHARSSRAQGPFVLFGAWSMSRESPDAERPGTGRQSANFETGSLLDALQKAQGGTILLDEVCGLDRQLQELLAHCMDDSAIHRRDGVARTQLDTRIVAVTCDDPETAVRKGRLTEDLYWRLDVLRITITPLRERREDVAVLADGFLEQFAGERAAQLTGFAPTALRALHAHSWPGNVRELQNRVRRAIAMSDGEFITADDLGLAEVDPSITLAHLGDARAVAEKQMLMDALRHANGSASRAASLLGVSRATLYRLIGKHGLAVEETGLHRALSQRALSAEPAESGTGSRSED